MNTWVGLVDASSAIRHLRKRLRQNLSREVRRGHSAVVVVQAFL